PRRGCRSAAPDRRRRESTPRASAAGQNRGSLRHPCETSQFAGEELGLAVAERPVLVIVLDEGDHHVRGRDAARFLELLAEQAIEGFLLLLLALAADHLEHDH